MRKIIITLNLLFVCIAIVGQSKIISKYLLEIPHRTLQWTINGVTFSPTADEITIYPHEKGMDTIFFQQTIASKTIYDTIFSKIPNGQELIMTIGCCDDKFDIVKKEVYEESRFDYDENIDVDPDEAYSRFLASLEFGTLKFKILNKPASDTLLCVYSPISLTGQIITIDKDYGWIKPCRFGIIDNIIDIYIAKSNENIYYEIEDKAECMEGIDIVGWDGEKKMDILKQFGLRLFNGEKVIIQYDYLTGEMQLIVEQ